jgi:hypothetical protein
MVSEAYPTNPREASGLDPEAVHLGVTHFGLDGELARMAVLGGGAGLVVGYLTHLWLDEELM